MLEPERRVALVLLIPADKIQETSGGCGNVLFTLKVPTDGIVLGKHSEGCNILEQLQIAHDRAVEYCQKKTSIVLELGVPMNDWPAKDEATSSWRCSFDLDVSAHYHSGSGYLYGGAAITLDAAVNSRPPQHPE